jgi:Topoisomerase IA
MEEELDEVAEGKVDWQKLLSDFYFSFMEQIEEGKEKIVSLKNGKTFRKKLPQMRQ